MELKGKLIIKGEIEVLTGLHVGASKEDITIGGIDNPVVKMVDGKPYIPGSSLKGKIRSLLEISRGFTNINEENEVSKMFGRGGKESTPSLIYFRDAYWKGWNNQLISEIMKDEFTEEKVENNINRITSKAQHPRYMERVPAGALFSFEIVLNIVENSKKFNKFEDNLKLLFEGLSLLEDDYLGGSGSRGYGKIKIHLKEIVLKKSDYYKKFDEESKKEISVEGNVKENILTSYKKLFSNQKPETLGGDNGVQS